MRSRRRAVELAAPTVKKPRFLKRELPEDVGDVVALAVEPPS